MYAYKLPALGDGWVISRLACSLASGLADRLLERLETYRQRRRLAELDDRILKDIGLTRCDVMQETSRPFWG